ncbi:hypothetical protein BD769DRAFT_884244 [Suillus cothurnatus]|nr:hypothetical protein BD769DRAFT_884244 [Suillus cothurnatus]
MLKKSDHGFNRISSRLSSAKQTPCYKPSCSARLLFRRLKLKLPSCSYIFRPHCCTAFQGRESTDTLQSIAKKSRIDPDEPDVTVQTGMYAGEMFAANLAVSYLINLIIVDDVMWIWYYDRQGIIQSSGINFIQDLTRFMVLLYALQRFKLEDWGRNKVFLPVQVEGK